MRFSDGKFDNGKFDDVFPDTSVIEVRTRQEAVNFSNALSTTVLIDGMGPTSLFDAGLMRVAGCLDLGRCAVFTPYGLDADGSEVLWATYMFILDWRVGATYWTT